MLKIIKKSKGIFLIFDGNIFNSQIILDFNPFLKKERLTEGLICHLRARPPHDPINWSWGIYDIQKDEYYSLDYIDSDSIRIYSSVVEVNPLKPSHVFIYPNCSIKVKQSEDGKISGFIYQNELKIKSH